jgi:hypothetical protein
MKTSAANGLKPVALNVDLPTSGPSAEIDATRSDRELNVTDSDHVAFGQARVPRVGPSWQPPAQPPRPQRPWWIFYTVLTVAVAEAVVLAFTVGDSSTTSAGISPTSSTTESHGSSPKSSSTASIACTTNSGSTLLSCTGPTDGMRVSTPTFTVAANATLNYTESSNCVSGTMLLGIFQRGVSSIPEPSLFGCNSLTYPLTEGTYYVVISATGDWKLSVSAGPSQSTRSSPTTTSPPSPETTQPTTSSQGGDCTSGYNNTEDIDPSIPAPTHLTATLYGSQTSATQEIKLKWQEPPGYEGRQVFESTPPGTFADASACVSAGYPGVAFLTVNGHATYRFFVVVEGIGSPQTYSPPASVTLTVP